MTADEAKRIAEVLATVDGYCSTCALDAADEMAERFPEHDWPALVKAAMGWDDADE